MASDDNGQVEAFSKRSKKRKLNLKVKPESEIANLKILDSKPKLSFGKI